MRVVKFNKNKHFTPLVECLVARNSYIPTLQEMPKIGFATINEGKLVAAVFLRRVEGGYGQIDGLTSNPSSSKEDRHLAIDMAVSALLSKSRELNIINILFTSEDEGTILRSHKYGFKKSPLSLLAVDLNKRSM
jgi:hypothetical protein